MLLKFSSSMIIAQKIALQHGAARAYGCKILSKLLLHLDLDIHSCRQVQVRERFDHARIRIQNIEQALVHPDLVLLP